MRGIRLTAICAAIVMAGAAAVTAQEGGVGIELEATVVREGETVTGLVTSARRGDVRVSWRNALGDVFFVTDMVVDATSPGRFSFQAGGVSTAVGFVEAAGAGGRGRAAFVVLPKEDRFWQGFRAIADEAPQAAQENAGLSTELGVRGAMSAGREGAVAVCRAGLRPVARGITSAGALSLSEDELLAAAAEYDKEGKTEALVRDPSFSDRLEVARLTAEAGSQARALRVFAPAGFVVAEEYSVTRGNAALDFSFAEADLRGFRVYLAERGASLGEVSARWGRRYRDWSEVVPRTAREMKEAISAGGEAPVDLMPWALHREYMDGRLAGTMERISRGAASAAQSAGEGGINWSMVRPFVGISGGMAPSAYGGHDWVYLSGVSDFVIMSPEAPEWSWGLARDMCSGARVLVSVDGMEEDAARRIWRAAGDGMGGVVVGSYKDILGRIASRGKVAAGAAEGLEAGTEAVGDAVGEALAELLGLGDVLSLARRGASVAVVYSPASIRAGWMMEYLGSGGVTAASAEAGTEAAASWAAIFEDLGVDYRWISAREVALGGLTRGAYTAVVLPETWCLSRETVARLAEYAGAGGTVIADRGAGLLDRGYRAYEVSPADALFGISREPLTCGRALEAARGEAGKMDGLAEAEEGVVEVVNRIGLGRTVYLNTAVGGYSGGDGESRDSIREAVGRSLLRAGYEVEVQVVQLGRAIRSRVRTYVFGTTRIYVIDLDRGAEGFMEKLPVTVQFAWEGSVYDLRTREVRGHEFERGGRVEVVVGAWGPIVLAQMADRPLGLSVEAGFDGRALVVRASLETRRPAGDRLFAVDIYAPSGVRMGQLGRQVIAEKGLCVTSTAMPLNSSAGIWRVLVRDLATGMASWSDVLVE